MLEQAWVSEDATTALLAVSMHRRRWASPGERHVVAVDLSSVTARDLGRAWWTEEFACDPASRTPASACLLLLDDQTVVAEIDPHTGRLDPPQEQPRIDSMGRAGRGWKLWRDHRVVFFDPFAEKFFDAKSLGLDGASKVFIGATGWYLFDGQWHEFRPSTGERKRAEWMDAIEEALPVMAGDRLLCRLRTGELAFAELETRSLARIRADGGSLASRTRPFLPEVQGTGEILLSDGEHKYAVTLGTMSLESLDASYDGVPLRRLENGDLVLLDADTFVLRDAGTGGRRSLATLAQLASSMAP
jgi:hypothetical protein